MFRYFDVRSAVSNPLAKRHLAHIKISSRNLAGLIFFVSDVHSVVAVFSAFWYIVAVFKLFFKELYGETSENVAKERLGHCVLAG